MKCADYAFDELVERASYEPYELRADLDACRPIRLIEIQAVTTTAIQAPKSPKNGKARSIFLCSVHPTRRQRYNIMRKYIATIEISQGADTTPCPTYLHNNCAQNQCCSRRRVRGHCRLTNHANTAKNETKVTAGVVHTSQLQRPSFCDVNCWRRFGIKTILWFLGAGQNP